MSDVTDDDDLRDVFRLLYEGDEWDEWDFDDDMEGNRDGEVEVEDAGGLTVGDEKVKGQGVEARLGERVSEVVAGRWSPIGVQFPRRMKWFHWRMAV